MNTRNNQRGFVLVTSLIFLVVVTLLAVAAINRSTLQEKIATNTRARETAEQHANAALREAEALLTTAAFETYQQAGKDVSVTAGGGEQATSQTVHVWYQGNIPVSDSSGSTIDTADEFLAASVWADDGSAPIKYKATDGSTLARYYIEELAGCYQADLDPDACATGRVVIYRITARAQYGKATVVTQSTFEKYY